MVYLPLPGGAQLCEQVLMRFALVLVYDSQVLFIYVHRFLYVSYWKGSTTSSAALLLAVGQQWHPGDGAVARGRAAVVAWGE